MVVFKHATLPVIAFVFIVQTAQAALTISIDTANETFQFIGSDTGTPMILGPGAAVNWNIPFTLPASEAIDISSGVSASETVQSSDFAVGTSGGLSFSLGFSGSPVLTTVTGLGTPISYIGLTPDTKASFESMIGGSMVLVQGSGYSPISVIPEPSVYAIATGLLALALIGYRRR